VTSLPAATPPSVPPDPIRSYPRFLWAAFGEATDGGLAFGVWMSALTAILLVGVNAWAHQVVEGMGITAMTDQVSWGLYIGNFTFAVGVAAGTIIMVIPAFLYHDEDLHDVVIVGQVLAISATVVALSFVNVDLGRFDHGWHLLPGVGRFHWPGSMLTWDVLVQVGWLVLNLHVVGYLLYMRYLGRGPNPRFYQPFIFLSIGWAIFVLTVEAFLYSGLGGRPYWNTAVLAPRFVVSAFVTGPAVLVLALQFVQRATSLRVANGAIDTLCRILQVTLPLDLFLVFSEVFTQFYTGGQHEASAAYLYFGLHGHDALVPFIWTAIACNVTAALLFLLSKRPRQTGWINVACVLAIFGLWIEKGLGLIVPAFVPSTIHEVVEYLPNQIEWKVSLGILALGFMVFTLGIKIVVAVFSGEMALRKSRA
jgi:Ni/Fe-hydrogenase subunit HybB-like protein